MKKVKKQSLKNRSEWIEQMNDEIDNLNLDIDELDLPEDVVLAIEKKINKFRDNVKQVINEFEVSPEIANENDTFFENFLDEVYFERIIAGNYEIERMKDIVTQSESGEFVKLESLAERIKFDEFISDFTENPYQLKMAV